MRHIPTLAVTTTQADYGVNALHADREGVIKVSAFYPRFNTSLTYQGTVDLTPELAERLVSEGWDRSKTEDSMREGARYSPSRGSLVCAFLGMFD